MSSPLKYGYKSIYGCFSYLTYIKLYAWVTYIFGDIEITADIIRCLILKKEC